jgi:hypothetical protein
MDGVKDFSRKREPIRFRIDDDMFEAAPALPAGTLAEFAARFSGLRDSPGSADVAPLYEALSMVLLPESYERFAARMKDLAAPIDVNQLNDVIVWLMEHYGKRPTVPSSISSPGAADQSPGMNSTDAQHPAVSISSLSPQTVS